MSVVSSFDRLGTSASAGLSPGSQSFTDLLDSMDEGGGGQAAVSQPQHPASQPAPQNHSGFGIMDAVHGVLTAGSFLPSVFGSAASYLDAGVYAAQGDWTDAGISAGAATIGLVSDAGAAKLAAMGVKEGVAALKGGEEAASLAAKLGHAGADAAETAKTAANVVHDGEDAASAAKTAQHARGAEDATAAEHTGGANDNAKPAGGKTVKSFTREEDFNRAANHAEPNSTYDYGGYKWSTDASGRVESVEGKVTLNKVDGRAGTDGVGTTSIGHSADAKDGDIGFHLIGDQFNGPTNKLNVVPGNGTPANGLANLNQGAYASWERQVKNLAKEPGNSVEVRVEPRYNGSNTTSRPDAFVAKYRVNGGDWVNTIFRNRAGG
jgi:DNA/RNA non-specific endonuclease